jgi:hypothetical protein
MIVSEMNSRPILLSFALLKWQRDETYARQQQKGAKTFSTTTLSRKTFSTTTLSIMTFSNAGKIRHPALQ